tara:strand:+ start:139 stop:648 length:510 start_codon:yes stop_codon:yes gene_type:complete
MDENEDKNLQLRDKFKNFYTNNKYKFFITIGFIFLIIISIIILDIKNKKDNKLISERYILASLYLSSNQNEKATEIYKEIIQKKNKFYSILALNTILEKKLITSQDEILRYFDLVENLNIPKEQEDIIIFKKALYLLKTSKSQNGKELMQSIANSNSNLKSLAEDILSD